ncbi:MAG TPA: hypothetical protein ENG33_10250 [Chloroflexi bacterium]|nr:hypothetical protein [Chloroflexota bacterium]
MTRFNIFDRVLKIIARDYAELFLQLAFPGLGLRLVETLENVELALPERRVDFIHRVEWEDEEYLLHLEFQLRHRADFPRRMCHYSAMLSLQLGEPVLSLALYLEPRKRPIPNEYVVKVGDTVINSFTYPVLKLWEFRDEVWQGKYRELAPLLISLVEEPTPQVLAREKELILAEEDRRKRANLLAAAVTVASRYFEKDFLWDFFREEVEEMRHASFIEDWLEKERAQSLQQGIQQGRKEGAVQFLRKLVLKRFGVLPSWLIDAPDGWTPEQMDALLDIALEAETAEEFEARAKKVLGL